MAGNVNAILYMLLIGICIATFMMKCYVEKYLPDDVYFCVICMDKKDTFFVEVACVICFITALLDTLFMGMTGAFPRLFTKHLSYFVIGLVIAVVIVTCTAAFLDSFNQKVKPIKKYQDSLQDIEERLKTIKDMRVQIRNDLKISQEDKNKQLKMLNDTEDTLKKAYSDIKQAYNAYLLIPTLKNAKDLSTDDTSRADLQRQLDVLEAVRKL